MLAVEAVMAEEEKAGYHIVAFGAVGSRIIACDGAGASSDSVVENCNHPASSALELICRAITDEGGSRCLRESVKEFDRCASSEVGSAEESRFPVWER